ncbi:hypothetical protein LTR36_009461 [Oleoguttula mirabilis]|uniref:Uncharacterized protein n=1 Tax=Oleoguttula mirabilis TaxID=1507867 RepID=A0AAV9JU72_9PEZI|nr:hypothetical protein LTR36_009461 [Oleoguttula mirabilis]
MSDTGHYNCRDYHISPHLAPTTLKTTHDGRYQLPRHESFDELMHRSRSPASFKPKFPLLKLPLELRQEIFRYLLPRTKELLDKNPLASHARNFSAVQKRGAKGMELPAAASASNPASTSAVKKRELKGMMLPAAAPANHFVSGNVTSNIVWQRGNINLFSVCRQLHDECAELVYGSSTFLLFITFAGITFRFRWLIPNGLAPSSSKDFLELLPERYMRLVKRVVVHIDHVDSYTGMLKFNVGGKGLTHGLRRQVQRLVNALKPPPQQPGGNADCNNVERRLTKVTIRVSNGNAVLDAVKPDIIRQREGGIKVAGDLELMLEPLRQLYGVREVSISGAVMEDLARSLTTSMRSDQRPECDARHATVDVDDAGIGAPLKGVCVYGNDL